MFCPNCGNQLPDSVKFCTKCGSNVGQPMSSQPEGGRPQPEQARQAPAQPTSRDAMLAAQKQAYAPPPPPPPGGADFSMGQPQAAGFSPGDCISQGWAIVKQHFGVFLAGTLIYTILSVVTGSIPGVSLLVGGPLSGGFFVFCFKAVYGAKPEVGDLFKGFSRFVPLLLVYIVSAIFIGLGIILLIIPGIYLAVSYSFAIPLIVDQNLDFWEAMETSRKTVSKCWGSVFALLILNGLVALLGILCFGVGIFVALPVIMCSRTYAYTQLFQKAGRLP